MSSKVNNEMQNGNVAEIIQCDEHVQQQNNEITVKDVLENNIALLNTFSYKNNDEVQRFGIIALTVIENTQKCLDAFKKDALLKQQKEGAKNGNPNA